jgi:hypothetical protein
MTQQNAMNGGGARPLDDLVADTPDPFILALGLRGLEQHVHRLRRGPPRFTGQATEKAIAARESLRAILLRAGASQEKTEELGDRALEAAFRFRRKIFLLDQHDRWNERKDRATFNLQRQLRAAADCVDKLPTSAKGKLNQVLKEVDWKTFDTETFIFIIERTLAVLATTSPRCKAQEVRLALVEDHRLPEKVEIGLPDIARTGRPWVIELWEASHACRQLENEIRRVMRGRQSRELGAFLKYLAGLVSYEELVRPDPAALTAYIQEVRSIADEIDIGYWPGYDYFTGKHVERDFQAFARNALAAVGDERPISTRQLKRAAKSNRSNPKSSG